MIRNALRPCLLAAVLLQAASCKKDQGGTVPVAAVDISININNPAYADIQVPGGWLYLTGGSMGIIVYRKTIDEFVALDRLCTYQSADLCKVYVDDSGVIAKDTTCCHSAFLILDGSVTQGPASLGLTHYNTNFNGTTLRIFN